jgi:ADP-ribose pyrophosphatase YjhB (NUDIX family)
VYLTEELLAPIRDRFGEPVGLTWEGEISDREWATATYNPARVHDITLFITNGGRLALIRKPHFDEGVWRTPGGGIKPGEDFVEGVVREALEETGLRVELERYLVAATARFRRHPDELTWHTHVFHATTEDDTIAPQDEIEIAEARWGTLDELAGPIRQRLLETGRGFWRYRVALHDAATAALRSS